MAKKKKTKKKAAAKAPEKMEELAAVPEEKPPVMEETDVMEPALREPAHAAPESAANAPGAVKKDGDSLFKKLAVGAILVLALALAYYFLVLTNYSFAAGTQVDEETFKGLFLDAGKVYIVMDVRGVGDYHESDNVMQCGVDFAASTGVADKSVVPISIGNGGCVTPNGPTPMETCFSMLRDGMTIYVRGGDGGVQYYNNGMVVYVGKDYTFGTCGIKKY